MKNKKTGLGSGLNNTITSNPPKEAFYSKNLTIEEDSSIKILSKRKFSILLTGEENRLLKRVAKRHNLSDSSALHFILADFEKRNPEIL